jgi:hypothetical protein
LSPAALDHHRIHGLCAITILTHLYGGIFESSLPRSDGALLPACPTNLPTLLLGKPTSLALPLRACLEPGGILQEFHKNQIISDQFHKKKNTETKSFPCSKQALSMGHGEVGFDPNGETFTLHLNHLSSFFLTFLPLCNHDSFLYAATIVKAKKLRLH